eukprot:TRINITY_DN480_c0_g1_i1.p1 TRINITY_DN480_c0_g1~~TRINITY_DN480_c0_g1_i1.p1  ORF type:complete len:575 (-),score=100.51 TRINITY_DN480_c0_g1_i1:629-2353(-)
MASRARNLSRPPSPCTPRAYSPSQARTRASSPRKVFGETVSPLRLKLGAAAAAILLLLLLLLVVRLAAPDTQRPVGGTTPPRELLTMPEDFKAGRVESNWAERSALFRDVGPVDTRGTTSSPVWREKFDPYFKTLQILRMASKESTSLSSIDAVALRRSIARYDRRRRRPLRAGGEGKFLGTGDGDDSSPSEEDIEKVKSCVERIKSMTQVEQAFDPYARAVWAHQLASYTPHSVDGLQTYAMGTNKLTAARLTLKDDREEDVVTGWYKPCGRGDSNETGAEWPENEIIGYQIANAIGYHFLAPAVSRDVASDGMVSMVDKQTEWPEVNQAKCRRAMEYTKLKCGAPSTEGDGHLPGIMIGWWDYLMMSSVLFPIRRHKAFGWTETLRRDTFVHSELEYVVPYHMFTVLLNNNAHNTPYHNNFRLFGGPSVTVDIDRADFERDSSVVQEEDGDPIICHICRFPRHMYQLLLKMNAKSGAPPNHRLSALVELALEHEGGGLHLGQARGERLDRRVESMVFCIDDCILRYGVENVLYDLDPTPKSIWWSILPAWFPSVLPAGKNHLFSGNYWAWWK